MNNKYVFGFGELLFDLLPDGKHLGGAPVNFTYHLSQCGFHAIPVSAVGQDENGKELLESMQKKGLPLDGISSNEFPTGTAGVQIVNGCNLFSISEPAAWDRIILSDKLLDTASSAAAVCFGTLSQRSPWNRQILRTFIRHTPDSALRILDVNFRQHYYSEEILLNSLELCNVLKVSEEEYPIFEKLLKLSGQPWEVLAKLAEKYRLRNILFTRGADGASVLTGGKWYHQPCEPCSAVVDTVGCGDGFTSYWTASVLAGKSDLEALQIAGKAASFIAGCSGAMPAMPEKIIRLVR